MSDPVTFNQFQKELKKHNVDPRVSYFLTLLYERQTEQAKLLALNAQVLTELTKAVQSFVQLHEAINSRLAQLMRQGRPDGVEVASVLPEPEKH